MFVLTCRSPVADAAPATSHPLPLSGIFSEAARRTSLHRPALFASEAVSLGDMFSTCSELPSPLVRLLRVAAILRCHFPRRSHRLAQQVLLVFELRDASMI